MKTLRASVLLVLSCSFLSPSVLFSARPRSVGTQANTIWTVSRTWLNINKISTQFRNDGQSDVERTSSSEWNSAFVFPKGSRKKLVFESGLLWGLKTDSLHVGGSTYISGLQPGTVLSPGVPEDPNLPKNRIYRVRPDYSMADLSSEVLDEQRSAGEIRAQYETDWNQWPATDGAPFDDRNSNGIYEPSVDIPGFKGADQTIWFVCNDLDTALTRGLYGSSPVGIEMQVTIWAYDRPGALGNIVFKNYRLTNKSTVAFDSMWVTQVADVDLGDAGDDYAGCDTTLGVTFGYNGGPTDFEYGGIVPPGVAFAILNAPMTAAYYEAAGDVISWPPFTYEGTVQWYNWMRGLILIGGQPFIHPWFPGQPTRFWLDGDPITGTGRLDGVISQPGDRSIGASTGPFTLMPGETKNIVIAASAGIGSNNLTSVAVLRNLASAARSAYPLLSDKTPPRMNAVVTYPTSSQATIQFVIDDRPSHAASLAATLRRQDGTSISQVTLFDDGTHNDSAANDGIWGNSVTIAREGYGLYVDVMVNSDTWERLYDHLTISGPVYLTNQRVFSDNVNSNGEVNPGENIRYGFRVTNGSAFYLGGIGTSSPAPDFRFIKFNPLLPGASDSLAYNGNDTLTYFSFTAPQSGIKTIPFSITDTAHNKWTDTLRFSVIPFPHQIYGSPVNHIAGITEWGINIQVVNPTIINNHTYEITVADTTVIGEFGDSLLSKAINLRDVTSGTQLLQSHELPDEFGHNMPVTEGFKVLQGKNFGQVGLRTDSTRWISTNPVWLQGNRFTFYPQSAFNGGATTGAMLSYYLGAVASNYDAYTSYPVEVRFDANAPQKAYRLRRVGNYLIQSFSDVPFSVWDVRDRLNPRQLSVAWRDNDLSGTWNPAVQSDNIEIVFIYNKTYDPTGTTQFSMPPNAIPGECTVGSNADIMYGLSLAIIVGHTLNESPGTLYLRPTFALNTDDRFTFNPTVVLSVGQNDLPTSFALFQNYPNPFNPSTTIQYQLPVASRVTIKIYNILGQQVVTLVDEAEEAGSKSLVWNGTNGAGNSVASGVYFYRIEARDIRGSMSFVQVKKLLLLR